MSITCKEAIERLKDILATQGEKPKDSNVAKALKIDANTLAQAKFQNRIPYKAIMDFLNAKNISINQFFYGADPKEVALVSEQYKILKLYRANASAGGGCINERVVYQEVVIDKEILQFLKIESCELIIAIGDSMEGVIADNSLCLISRVESSIKNGKIYAINTLDGLFIKQCFIKDDNLNLMSINKSYKAMSYPINEVMILGRLRGVISRII